jgi:hypothetical protein
VVEVYAQAPSNAPRQTATTANPISNGRRRNLGGVTD